MKRGMNIGQAVEALNNGERLSREGWSDSHNVFIFRQIPAEINKSIVPNMQSLPDLVKKHFQWIFNSSDQQISSIYYSNQIAKVGLSNSITAYSPSVSDLFATDWYSID
jgi:hypothetical protein